MNFPERGDAESKTLGDVMSTDLVTLNVNDTLRLADDIMNVANVRHFPVVHDDKLVGLLSQADLLHASMRSLVQHPFDSPRMVLGRVVVRDIMKPPITAKANISLQEAAAILVANKADCLLITEGDKLLGLASRTDLLRQLAATRMQRAAAPTVRTEGS